MKLTDADDVEFIAGNGGGARREAEEEKLDP
jgi:hypothetical protein